MTTERRQENKFIVYTDIVGHTKMLGRLGMAFKPMRERHDDLFRQAVAQHADVAVVKGSGDGFYAAFEDVDDAIEVALAFRRALATEDWTRFLPEAKRTPDNFIRSRVGIHSGQVRVQYDDGTPVDFDGAPRNVCEKVMSKAQGNQVLVTRQVRDQGSLNFRRNSEVEWLKYGEFKLREVADTVEVWGLGEAELVAGPAPVQDPEHRVIIFAVVHDHSTVIEQAGPQFEGLKDKWDATFQKAVDAHARDAFVKRLPEGSLAAFRTAIEAVRAARDFRRMWKAEMRTSIHRLEPKTALDSGLVTFSYENNRPADVRDQPVNMAAKVAKTGLTAPWQLLLTRPVREDAFSNMPERDEFAWVCVGRKAVPGEPEPVELWDFQDVQVKKEDRAVLWVDLTHIRDDLKARRDVYIRFVARLDAMLGEALARRAEQAWTLSPDAARIAAFRDPVEAVQAAIDLRDQALAEDWSQQFRNRAKGWHPLKIALHTGSVRMTSEDGQRKEIKGTPIEGLKTLIAACEMSQMLVSREFKETVSRHLPETMATWSRVDVPARNDVAVEGFELGARRSAGRPLWQKAAVGVIAAALVLGAGVMAGRLFLGGGGGGDGGGGEVVGTPRPMIEVLTELESEFGKIEASERSDAFRQLKDAAYSKVAEIVAKEGRMVSPLTQAAIKEAIQLLREVSVVGASRSFDLDEVMGFSSPALGTIKDGPGLRDWTGKVRAWARVPIESDDRERAMRTYQSLRDNLVENGLERSKEAEELEQFVRLPAEIERLAWVEGNRDRITQAVRASINALKGERNLEKRITDATMGAIGGGGEDPVPVGVRGLLAQARTQTRGTELEPVIRAAASGARTRALELRSANPAPSEDAVERDLEALVKPIAEALRDVLAYDTEFFVIDHAAQPERLTLEQIARLMRDELPKYRLMDEKRPLVARGWADRLDAELLPLRGAAPSEAVKAARQAAKDAVDRFPPYHDLPWIAKNQERITAARAGVEQALASLAAAVAKQAETLGPTGTTTVALGPLPDATAKLLDALAGDKSAEIARIGAAAKALVNASWEEARRQGRSPEAAAAQVQAVVVQLQALSAKKGQLDAAAIAADRERFPEMHATPGSLAALEGWLSRMSGYVRIEGEDPRPKAEQRLEELRARYIGAEEGKVPDPPAEFREARSELQNIRPDTLPWIEKNREFIVAPAERLAKALAPGGPVEVALTKAAEARRGAAAVEIRRTRLREILDGNPVNSAAEPEIDDAWREFVREKRGKLVSSDADELATAVQEAEEMFGFFADLGKRFPVPEMPEDRPWIRSVALALQAQRADSIRTAIGQRGKPGGAAAVESWKASAARASRFVATWRALEDGFRLGLQLDDPLEGAGKSVRAAITEVRDDPLLKAATPESARVRDALSRPVRRAESLLAVEKFTGSLAELVRYADDADVGIETRIAVWNTMGAEAFLGDGTGGAGGTWIRDHLRVFKAVEDSLRGMDDARARAIRDALKVEKPKRWLMYVSRASSFNALDVAMGERAAFEIDDRVIDSAEPRVRWNVRVWEVESAFKLRDEARTGEAIGRVLADAGAVRVGEERAGAFVADLRAAAGGASGAGGGVVGGGGGADKIGPGSAGWTLTEGALGAPRLVYRMPDPKPSEPRWMFDGEAPELTFVKVRDSVDAYVCTTELSVRVAFETLRRNREEAAFTGLYLSGGNRITRTGPYSWDFNQGDLLLGYVGGRNLIDRGKWVCMGTANDPAQIYGPAQVGQPEPDSPMQYVSLPGAVFLARLVGCRLPTVGEWAAAAAIPGSIAGTPNLRDQAYEPVYRAVLDGKQRFGGSVTDPDNDVFGQARTDRGRFAPQNDGVPFFQSVKSGEGVFKHMIGNVAELLCDDRRAASEIATGLNRAITFVEERKEAGAVFAIVGDSAIAAPQVDPKQPRFLTYSRASENAMMKRGWSDVGLRLAFTGTPPATPVALGEQGLLVRVQKAFAGRSPYVASN